MDPFQIRMDFSSQLRRLSASQQSIQKVVYTMSKHASRASDDLWDCIVREASKASLNARLNILFLIDALVTGADGALSADPSSSAAAGLSPLVLAAFRPLITRDLVSLIDNVVPLTPDGIRLNLASTRAVVSSWRTGSILSPDLLTHILDRLEARRDELARLPLALQTSDTEFSRAEVLQRIEEDRERQKRLRERSWILPPKTYGNAIPHPPEALSASGATSASGGTSLHQTASGTPGQPSSSSSSNQTNASGQPTSTPASAAAKSLGKRARVSTADNAALTRDPLAALYGDTGPSASPSSSNTPSSSALKRSAAAGSTPAKRKANGSLVPPSTPTTSTANQAVTGSGSAAIIGTGNDSSAPIIIDDTNPSAPSQPPKPLTVPPSPNDALQIEMEEMWEITSDLNEDDFEAFAEEDGVGVGVGVSVGPGSGFGLVGPAEQGIKVERNGHQGQQGNGNGNGKVGVTILGVASHNGPSTTARSTGGGSIVPAAPAPGPADVVPRWWGSRAVFVQQRQQYSHSHSHSPQQPQVRNNQK
ncbi:unnamed protein product [Tilletia laevis]|uniref:Uncharacterized protein n=2 Tax=Tilletia TaxID=13289 RepID=A0A9N8M4X4_9BASI|nr:hypothetical protein CF328_g7827 [Tilletia controversa]CAD6907304.1 unnamed protein product [Tilletia caries]CAD6941319.1 unnamed protein product [Tilletia laevis]CAD6926141.1 unnamed protein product [Tilletia controversa]CAD6959468.1 unnamed protein product [Tilletia laevis]